MKIKPEFKSLEKLKMLLQQPEEVVLPQILTTPKLDLRDDEHNNWLSYAANQDMVEHVAVMLDSPYRQQLLQAMSYVPLLSAIRHNHKAMALLLIKHGAPLHKEGVWEIVKDDELFQAFARQKSYLSYLLNPKARSDGQSSLSWLCYAASTGDLSKVTALLADPYIRRILVNAPGAMGDKKPLDLALENGHLDVAEKLIEAGATFNLANTLSGRPAEKILRSSRIMQHIVSSLPSPPRCCLSLARVQEHWLTYAAWEGRLEVVKIILAAPEYREMLLDRPGENGWTALEWALELRHFEVALELMKHNPKIHKEQTALKIHTSGHAGLLAQFKSSTYYEKYKPFFEKHTFFVTKLQACIRAQQAERQFRSVEAVASIQSQLRVYLAERQFSSVEAATTVQTSLRTYWARQSLFSIKAEEAESSKLDVMFQEELDKEYGAGKTLQLLPKQAS